MRSEAFVRARGVIAGLLFAWIAFDVLVWAFGESPLRMATLLVEGTWGTAYGAGQVIFKATPIFVCAIAVRVAFRAGLFNIGAEGQMMVAGLAVGVVGARLPDAWPSPLGLAIVAIVAATAGGAWALVPAVMRARWGAHEVISTIMLNRLAQIVVGGGLASGLALEGTVQTPPVGSGLMMTRLSSWFGGFAGSAASTASLWALGMGVLAMAWAEKSRIGVELDWVARGRTAARMHGVPVRLRLAQALVVSGAIAGLAGIVPVSGYKGYYELGLGAGAGFAGIAAAMLGGGSVVGMLLAALLMGTLAQGGLAINAFVPREVTEIVQAAVIVGVALGDSWLTRWAGRAPSGKVAN